MRTRMRTVQRNVSFQVPLRITLLKFPEDRRGQNEPCNGICNRYELFAAVCDAAARLIQSEQDCRRTGSCFACTLLRISGHELNALRNRQYEADSRTSYQNFI